MRRLNPSPTVLHVSLSRGSHVATSEDSRQVRVSVWWDLENCNVPSKTNIFRVASAISAAVRATGIRGPMEITAFADMIQLSRIKQEGLSVTGVNLAHVPHNGKNSADRTIIANLMYWVSQNPPPAHLFLISGDKDFAGILHKLRMSNYNILLASPQENSPGVLCSAASVVWNWHDLLRGENLAGKCFNQPPDGPHHSWYGHYRAPLFDPFAATKGAEESKSHIESESELPVHLGTPATIRRRIRRMLRANHPDGILISDLRNELGKDESFDKENYYGYKKFITFLMSMEDDILRVRKCSSGQFAAYYISHSSGRSESACDRKSFEDSAGKKTQRSSPEKAKEKDGPRSDREVSIMNEEEIVETPYEKVIEVVDGDLKIGERQDLSRSSDEKVAELVKEPESGSKLPAVVELEPSSEPGILTRFWRKWFGSESSGSDTKRSGGGIESKERVSKKDLILKTTADSEKGVTNLGFANQIQTWFMNTNTLETKIPSGCSSDEERLVTTHSMHKLCGIESKERDSKKDLILKTTADSEKGVTNPGFANQIQTTLETKKPSGCSSDEERLVTTHSKHKLFSKDSFWGIMETFMDTPRGSRLVSESKTRQEIAHELRRQGPYCLLSLDESLMSRLVDLLIEEKKWVEECPSELFPFKLSRTEKSHTHEKDENSLRSLFRSRVEESKAPDDSSRSIGEDQEESLPGRSKSEVLADCQSLVDEIARENPKELFAGLFRRKFLDRFGYHLDYQRLGYHGLNPLINSMSGVKIRSGYIVSEESSPKNGDGFPDSNWEELGPITDSRTTLESKSEKNEVGFEYEPAASEDELSGRDETRLLVEKKVGEEEEDSSLLRILDSWHGSKAQTKKKKKEKTKLEEGLDSSQDFLNDGVLGFISDFEKKLSETTTRAWVKKHGTKKEISFVLEVEESDKERAEQARR